MILLPFCVVSHPENQRGVNIKEIEGLPSITWKGMHLLYELIITTAAVLYGMEQPTPLSVSQSRKQQQTGF